MGIGKCDKGIPNDSPPLEGRGRGGVHKEYNHKKIGRRLLVSLSPDRYDWSVIYR